MFYLTQTVSYSVKPKLDEIICNRSDRRSVSTEVAQEAKRTTRDNDNTDNKNEILRMQRIPQERLRSPWNVCKRTNISQILTKKFHPPPFNTKYHSILKERTDKSPKTLKIVRTRYPTNY